MALTAEMEITATSTQHSSIINNEIISSGKNKGQINVPCGLSATWLWTGARYLEHCKSWQPEWFKVCCHGNTLGRFACMLYIFFLEQWGPAFSHCFVTLFVTVKLTLEILFWCCCEVSLWYVFHSETRTQMIRSWFSKWVEDINKLSWSLWVWDLISKAKEKENDNNPNSEVCCTYLSLFLDLQGFEPQSIESLETQSRQKSICKTFKTVDTNNSKIWKYHK